MQTWRSSLLQEAQHWTIVMKVKMQSIVTEAVGQDRVGCTDSGLDHDIIFYF